MLAIISMALVILVCSYRKRDSQSSSSEVNEDVKSQAMAKNLETNSEPEVLVIMAGNHNPTYLAKPITSSSIFCTCGAQPSEPNPSSTSTPEWRLTNYQHAKFNKILLYTFLPSQFSYSCGFVWAQNVTTEDECFLFLRILLFHNEIIWRLIRLYTDTYILLLVMLFISLISYNIYLTKLFFCNIKFSFFNLLVFFFFFATAPAKFFESP